MDVREGGRWTAVMRGPKDHVIHWDGEYVEVRELERLSFTVSDQPGADVYDLCTVDLTDLGGRRTEMLFTQSAAICPPRPTAVPSKAGPASSPGSPSASRPMNLARANRLRDDFQIEQEEIE